MELLHTALDNQNEVLKLAGTNAQKYTELFEYAPSGYFILSKKGIIIELNHCFAQIIEADRKHLIHKQFDLFVSDDTKQA
jgi:uncharacterized protein YfbU (UPF0304 family)